MADVSEIVVELNMEIVDDKSKCPYRPDQHRWKYDNPQLGDFCQCGVWQILEWISPTEIKALSCHGQVWIWSIAGWNE